MSEILTGIVRDWSQGRDDCKGALSLRNMGILRFQARSSHINGTWAVKHTQPVPENRIENTYARNMVDALFDWCKLNIYFRKRGFQPGLLSGQ